MSAHPYRDLPDAALWRKAVAGVPRGSIDPVGTFDLRIDANSKVATAGSCFAQHIARHLKNSGFHYFVAEDGHPILPEKDRVQSHYGQFSCRYGNIYTTRQLLQLMERAYDRFGPVEPAWQLNDGRALDPFRPTIEPEGFESETEMLLDRAQHLRAVRRMFEELDVFVFTLGLTECWRSRADGAVFPICPGVRGGSFDPAKYEFYNQPVNDVIADLQSFAVQLKAVNPRANIVLTVSPVPLIATAVPDQHVLSATTYSKSVLRVAAETVSRALSNVHYFPSYEIVMGSYSSGTYFAADQRNVLEEGVEHVMRVFMKHAAGIASPGQASLTEVTEDSYLKLSERIAAVECDEAALDDPR